MSRARYRSNLPWAVLFGIAAALVPTASSAHATGENYVWLNVEPAHLTGRFEIRLTDLEREFGWTFAEAERTARQELERRAPEVQSYLASRFSVAVGGIELPYSFTGVDVVESGSDLGRFAQFHYRSAEIAAPDQIEIENRVLLDSDRLHRSLLCIQYDRQRGREFGEEFTALVFSASNDRQVLDLTNVEGLLRARDFIWQGVLHIWIGLDHVLFLIVLLLTAVVRPVEARAGSVAAWAPVDGFRPALWQVVRIVTLFTVAHSITLSLAALDVVRLPSRFVESAIALSIVLVAVDNIAGRWRRASWLVIFVFGLFHGLGFASVMGELPFRMGDLIRVVFAFNVGVELGQIAIVAATFPVLFLLRRSALYRPAILVGGSLAVGAVASWWFVTRAMGWA